MTDITVIITAYNRKDYLIKAVNSALNQSLDRSRYEVIVIKNFKDDKIDEYLNRNNIKNLVMDGTEGEYILRGIEEAQGKIISFLDDDDLFAHEKLQYVYEIFNEHQNLIYLHNAYVEIDNNDNLLELNSFSTKVANFNDFIINQNNNKSIIYGLKHLSDFNLSSISIAKSIKNTEYIRQISHMTDTSLFYLALTNNGIVYISPKRLSIVRFHISTTRQNLEDDDAILSFLQNLSIEQNLLFIKDYCKAYPFYNLIECNFYSNQIVQQIVKNQYHNVLKNVLSFFKCSFLINFKVRFILLLVYIISYITKSNKLFIVLFKRNEKPK